MSTRKLARMFVVIGIDDPHGLDHVKFMSRRNPGIDPRLFETREQAEEAVLEYGLANSGVFYTIQEGYFVFTE
jgi:hypothetical protein